MYVQLNCLAFLFENMFWSNSFDGRKVFGFLMAESREDMFFDGETGVTVFFRTFELVGHLCSNALGAKSEWAPKLRGSQKRTTAMCIPQAHYTYTEIVR